MKHPSYHAQQSPDKIAYQMTESGAALTYSMLESRSNQGAYLLRSLGVQRGDHIALMMENRLEFMEICWAAQRSGVFYTAISRYLSPEEAAFIVTDCGAKVFIISDHYIDTVNNFIRLIGPDIDYYMVGTTVEPLKSWDDSASKMPETPIADEAHGLDMLYSPDAPRGLPRLMK